MSHGKHFTLFTHVTGPNGWYVRSSRLPHKINNRLLRKVEFVFEPLGLTFESILVDIANGEHKRAPYTTLNPNGRIPALIDHANGDFVIWESDAILLYLVDKYDAEHKLSVVDEKERYAMIQWLFFQASGQGYVLR